MTQPCHESRRDRGQMREPIRIPAGRTEGRRVRVATDRVVDINGHRREPGRELALGVARDPVLADPPGPKHRTVDALGWPGGQAAAPSPYSRPPTPPAGATPHSPGMPGLAAPPPGPESGMTGPPGGTPGGLAGPQRGGTPSLRGGASPGASEPTIARICQAARPPLKPQLAEHRETVPGARRKAVSVAGGLSITGAAPSRPRGGARRAA
jgi:hypothetical protein